MSVESVIRSRYSVRKFQKKPVEAEKLEKLLDVARLAPTAANKQPNKVYVVQSEAALEKLSHAARIFDCPLALVFCTDETGVWTRGDGFSTVDIDASILTDEIMLLATELGLGSCWICAFQPDILRAEFGLPETLKPVNILALGYSADEPAPDRLEKRKPLGQLLVFT
ncbi:MAG: nitroreductase [Clostridia bacterium]|nr:nitroreductase [Clostridia bacterium]